MANDLQNSIYTAIDTIIEKRVEELELDKTVIASIEQLVDAEAKQYRVQYKGGSIYAYSQSDVVYAPHTSVYVSIPQNDFSKKKWIVGKVSEVTGDKAITEVSTAIQDYQIVGNNTISLNSEKREFGLYSYKPEGDALTLYSRTDQENNLLKIDEENLKLYLQNSIVLLIEATFRTDLDSMQKNRVDAEYGLIFDLIFEDGDATYTTRRDQFQALAPLISLKQENDGSISLASCNSEVYKIVQNKEINKEIALTRLGIQRAAVAAMQNQFSSEENELVNLYLSLLDEMIKFCELDQDWCAAYESWFAQNIDTFVTKRLIYQLDSNSMIGNPLLFKTSTEQYDIFPIDTGRFQYIEDITFYCKGFKGSADWETRGADIFVKDLEFYGLQELSSTNGDYSLRLSFPQGQVFEDTSVDEEENLIYPPNIKVKGNMTYKNASLSTGMEWFWFVKDGLVSSAGHEDYHYLGGVGWRWLDNVKGKDLTLSAKANTAYENIYKCVGVYNSTMTLKTEFTIYNNANRRVIAIESDLGERFRFDRGTPVLTCKILEPFMEETEPIEVPEKLGEYIYTYRWLRKDPQGQTIVFDTDYATLQEMYNSSSFSEQMVLKSKLKELENVTFDKNKLTYPVSNIASNSTMTFECYVYRRKEKNEEDAIYIGCGQIVLKNEAAATINDYYIVIENGDQVFQYTESGVSPCNERFSDPLEVRGLVCHLYDPNGLEVNSAHYTHKWIYPIGESLIIPPEELEVNPSNGVEQVYRGDIAPFSIQESYDYSSLNNQITCEVQYDKISVSKDTEFYFGKVGDNGTNGTDVVASIQPCGEGSALDNEPLTLISTSHSKYWNCSKSPLADTSMPLELRLYRRNSYIDSSEYRNVKWTMAGGSTKSKYFAAAASSATPHLASITQGSGKITNCIIKGEAKLEKVDGSGETQTHYAFYPIPIIEYAKDVNPERYPISIDKKRTLKHVLYNADGRNPMYNKKQGVFFNFSDDDDSPYFVSWEAKGGLGEEENTPAFDLFSDEDYLYLQSNKNTLDGCKYVYIRPKDVYSGLAQNNHVKATISIFSEDTGKLESIANVIIPIYFSLNLYGLASLNAWDGNTIEINEDNNYIMAPQIGAGVKNDDNSFTGIVMGKATTYDQEKEQVGLLGYSNGKQSIFLDAETGNATFGLPEQDERDEGSNLNEGRIEMRPGGLSSISGWKINSRSLFNVPDANKDEEYETWGGLSDPYEDLDDSYIKSIPHDKTGILLSSDPSYISIKGRPLKVTDNIDFDLANTIVKPGDTFELQLDPNDDSIFTIYRHTTAAKSSDMGIKYDEETENYYVGLIYVAESESDANAPSDEELNKQYTVAIQNEEGMHTWGWETKEFSEVGHEKEYLVPYPCYEKKYQDGVLIPPQEEKIIWLIKAVKKSGIYYPEDFEVEDKKEDPSIWRREPRVGINNQGRFYTNALKSSSSALTIDSIGAFGQLAENGKYVGASFEVGSSDDKSLSLIKMFTPAGKDNANLDDPSGYLFISGSSNVDNEYIRPMRLYGNSVTLLSQDGRRNNSSYFSKNRLRLDANGLFAGSVKENVTSFDGEKNPQTGSFLDLKKEDPSRLNSLGHFTATVGKVQSVDDKNYPWLLGSFSLKGDIGTSNLIAKVSSGSIASYAYGTDDEEGRIGTYASNEIELIQAKRTESGGAIRNNGIKFNDSSMFVGNIDSIATANLQRSEWSNAQAGTSLLATKISSGSLFQSDSLGTTLLSNPKIGLYSQKGIDIVSLKSDDNNIGDPVVITAQGQYESSTLQLVPQATEDTDAARLSSRYGYIGIRQNCRSGFGSSSTNGVVINPGFLSGFGIFDGSIASTGSYVNFSMYAKKRIKAENFSFHEEVDLHNITSYYVKELLYYHTHPFSKTVTISANDIKNHVSVSGGKANGGTVTIYRNNSTWATHSFTGSSTTISSAELDDVNSLTIALNSPTAPTVSGTSFKITVSGTSGIAGKQP